MKFSTTIRFRIALGFGLLTLAILVNAILSYRSIVNIQQASQDVTTTYAPSVRALVDMKNLVHLSGDHIQNWAVSGMDNSSPMVTELDNLIQKEFPAAHKQILNLSQDWAERDRENYKSLYNNSIDSIFLIREELFQASILQEDLSDDRSEVLLADLERLFQKSEEGLAQMIRKYERLSEQANQEISDIFKRSQVRLLITGLIIALVSLIIAVLLFLSLVKPVKKYRAVITDMGRGFLPDEKMREGEDEMGQIGTALNSLIQGLKNLANFSERIGKGDFESDFEPLSEKDILGNSLIRMREDLKNAALEEKKRKEEDERRNWSNQGIARFSEILRENANDFEELTQQVISELVKYMDARVGGLFLVNMEDAESSNVELVASYAYDRKKHLKKTIESGEGLIGRCIQEGETILMTDIPDNYLSIKSGLGEDNPRSLLIVPLRMNEDILGILELASLNIFEAYQIEFAERIGSSIASSVSAVKAGIRASRLLKKSQLLTDDPQTPDSDNAEDKNRE